MSHILKLFRFQTNPLLTYLIVLVSVLIPDTKHSECITDEDEHTDSQERKWKGFVLNCEQYNVFFAGY